MEYMGEYKYLTESIIPTYGIYAYSTFSILDELYRAVYLAADRDRFPSISIPIYLFYFLYFLFIFYVYLYLLSVCILLPNRYHLNID